MNYLKDIKLTKKYYNEELFNNSPLKREKGYKNIEEYIINNEYYLTKEQTSMFIYGFINSENYTNSNDKTILMFLLSMKINLHIVKNNLFLRNCITYSKHNVKEELPSSLSFRCDTIRDDVMDGMTVLDKIDKMIHNYHGELYLCIPCGIKNECYYEPFLAVNFLDRKEKEEIVMSNFVKNIKEKIEKDEDKQS